MSPSTAQKAPEQPSHNVSTPLVLLTSKYLTGPLTRLSRYYYLRPPYATTNTYIHPQSRTLGRSGHSLTRLRHSATNLSSTNGCTTTPKRLIPATICPVEVTNEVLHALAQPPVSHVSPAFAKTFQECIHMVRQVICTTTGQPFIIAGSGTLGWDQVAANLVEPGEAVLVLHTGYFGDGFKDCLVTYGAQVDLVKAPLGGRVPIAEVEAALKRRKYKAITITHVDTSTGVLSDAQGIAKIVKRVSPETLIILDGVCSVASEEIRMDAWGLDVVLTASQKGLGAPPGLSILIASQRALDIYKSRKTPVTSYYASWNKWLPIMKAYDQGLPAYFGTPPVNLITAFNASLKQITATGSLDERWRLHAQVSRRIKAVAEQLGMKQLAKEEGGRANGMTAVFLPEGIKAADVLGRLGTKGVVMAGGLVAEIKDRYIRIGHMGTSVVDDARRGDIEVFASALKEAMAEAKAERELANAATNV
ncbi:pyridoxal phosphate-dependent transferase [Crucibulum laeve]|uniref:alanine--glyoxylate transaminase n=1 Tax=Crucibulum laeve TaxID=68775 RepID=A0A5C3M490_9AGAR|nr:pyridoxal phosphate-dependent transferase [Crucibulum laeve]